MRREQPRGLFVVADPGPDPDDVKALLASVVVHKQGQLQLCGVIANGGGQPVRRARLARCILDRLCEPLIPVGVGSAGAVSVEQPHEMMLAGYSEVDDARLLDGRTLFRSVLRAARPKSLVIVFISSLRDFADVVAEEPELVLRATAEVVIQGGLTPDPTAPYGYRPDASQNNVFDMDAARAVYDFCFGARLKMAVVSREAVPLLPMQLAKSFATRTQSPLLVYLANAQLLGLVGLWVKVCAGSLPARCSKQWYFATFCGVDAAEFEARRLGALDEAADIGAHLKGYVKPYDVCALMMALPFAAARPVGSAVVVRGVQHSLLLSAAHQFDVWNVHNLLRDVYHVIASLDPAAGDGALPRRHAGAASYGVPPPCSVPLPYFVQSRDAARPLSTSSASASASASSTSARRRAGPAPNPYLARLTAQLAVSAGQSPHGRAGRMSRAQASILGRLSSRVSAAPSASEGARDTACTHGSSVRPRMTLRAAPQAAVAPWRDSAAAGASAGSSDGWSRASRFASARPGNSTRTSGRPTAHASHSRADNGQLSAPRSVTSSVREVRRLAAVRALSAEHVLSPERIVSVLGLALNLAQGRQRRLEVITLTIGGSVSGLGVVTLLTVSLRSGLNEATVRDMVDAWWLGRLAIAACAMVLGGTTALISLQPLPSQRRRIHALVLIFQCYLIAAVAFALAELTAEVRWLIARGARGEYDAVAIGVAIGHGYTLLVGGVLVAMTAAEHWRHRRELPHVLWLAHRLVWICLSGQALVELALVVCLARVGFFAQPDGAGLAVFAVLPPLVYAAGTAIACAPSFRERMRAALMVRLGALGALEALAPLAGYGSDRIERGVAAICAEALRDFRPVLLDEHALGALKAAWERAPCAVHEARSSASSRAGGSPSKRVAGGVGVRALSPLAAFDASLLAWSETQRADAYVVHAWADEPAGKLRALREYARAFAQKHGRPPAIWVDALCAVPHAAPARAAHALSAASRAPAMPWRPTAIARLSLKPAPIAPFELGVQGPHSPAVSPPRTIAAACGAQSAPRAAAVEPPRARSPTEGDGAAGAASARTSSPPRAFGTDEHASRQLEHLVLRIARSSQLLVLAGPSLFERLWCVVECYVWVTTGGSTERIALLPTTDEPADDAELLAAADTFHILYCDAAIVAHKWRLSLVAQTATVARMNSVMRALLNPLHAQLDLVARERRASEDAAGGAARGSRVEPLLHDEQGESDRAD